MATSIRRDDGRGDVYGDYLRQHGPPHEWSSVYDDVFEQQDRPGTYGAGEKPRQGRVVELWPGESVPHPRERR
jgi:hypothetical protein